ncbi:MAG: hypothetical protein AAFO83_00910 [Cyanobacteria bacterium J06607_13]
MTKTLPPILDLEASLLESGEAVFNWQAEILADKSRVNYSAVSDDGLASLSFTGDSLTPSEIALSVQLVSNDVRLRQLAASRVITFISAIIGISHKDADAWVSSRLAMKSGDYSKSGFRVSFKPLKELGLLIVSITPQGFAAHASDRKPVNL